MSDRDRYPGEWVVEHTDTREVLVHHEDPQEMVRLTKALPAEQRARCVIVGRTPRPGEPTWMGWMSL
jgi:hypothetical protein